MRQGNLDCLSKPPFILGSECAGVVEAVGEGVENVKVNNMICSFLFSNKSLVYKLF